MTKILEVLKNVDLLSTELESITIDDIATIEKNVKTVLTNKKSLLKDDAVKQIKALAETLGITYSSVSNIFKAPKTVETPKRKPSTVEEFDFTYEIDGALTTKREKATGNKSQAFKDAVASNPQGMLGLVAAHDHDRLKTVLDAQKKKKQKQI